MYNIDSKNYNQAFNQYFDLNTIVKKNILLKKRSTLNLQIIILKNMDINSLKNNF